MTPPEPLKRTAKHWFNKTFQKRLVALERIHVFATVDGKERSPSQEKKAYQKNRNVGKLSHKITKIRKFSEKKNMFLSSPTVNQCWQMLTEMCQKSGEQIVSVCDFV